MEEQKMKNLTRKEEQVLLAIHHLKDNAYLITIREQIKKYTGKNYSVGTIYAPLNRLHIHGYLESWLKKEDIPGSGKPIKYYRLTQNGYEALAEIKRLNEQMWEGFVIPAFKKTK